MLNILKRFHPMSVALFLLVFAVSAAHAGASLSKPQIEKLVTGNTMQGQHKWKGFQFSLFADSNGTLQEKRSGSDKVLAGKWSIDGEGRFCWSYDHKDKQWCRRVKDNGDGTYTKFKDDGKEVRSFAIVSGNKL